MAASGASPANLSPLVIMDFDAIANLLTQLSVHSPSASSFERVLVTVLKTHPTQVLPDINNTAKEIERLADLNPSDLIKCRASLNTYVFEYEVSPDKLEKILTCIPRIRIRTSTYKLYTNLMGYYRVQLNHLSFEALQKEGLVRKLFDLFEPEKKAKYVFIASNAIVRGKKFPVGIAVGFFEKRPRIIDHIEFLQTKRLRISIQFPNRAEAIEFKSKMKSETEKKEDNQEKIENKSSPNETKENEKGNEKEMQSAQNSTNKNVKKTAMRKDTRTEKELTTPSPPTTLTSQNNSKTTKTLPSQKNLKMAASAEPVSDYCKLARTQRRWRD